MSENVDGQNICVMEPTVRVPVYTGNNYVCFQQFIAVLNMHQSDGTHFNYIITCKRSRSTVTKYVYQNVSCRKHVGTVQLVIHQATCPHHRGDCVRTGYKTSSQFYCALTSRTTARHVQCEIYDFPPDKLKMS